MLVRDGEDDGSAAMEVHGQEERSCHDEYHSCQTHHGASLATVVARAARRIGGGWCSARGAERCAFQGVKGSIPPGRPSCQTGDRIISVMNLVDAQRTARLLFDPELTSGRLGESDVVDGQAISTLRAPPSLLLRSRLAAASSAKFGWTDGVAMQLGHTLAVRRALLGEDAVGAPRFLVRIDEFPCAGVSYAPERYGLEAFERFVDALASTGNPYLLAVVPELANEYLNASGTGDRALSDEECDLLRRLPSDKVVIAQHGTTHRTRYQNPRRHSELSGLSPADLATVVDRGRETLLRLGFQPRIFVPPFNRFDDASWNVLTDRFDVVTGGPETLRIVGALPAPVWRGSSSSICVQVRGSLSCCTSAGRSTTDSAACVGSLTSLRRTRHPGQSSCRPSTAAPARRDLSRLALSPRSVESPSGDVDARWLGRATRGQANRPGNKGKLCPCDRGRAHDQQLRRAGARGRSSRQSDPRARARRSLPGGGGARLSPVAR